MTTFWMSKPGALRAEAPSAALPAAASDARTFEQLVLDLAPDVLRMLRGLGVHSADLDDVCQETFIVVHRRLPSFEGRSTLRTWVCGIALRVALDYRSKQRRQRERTADAAPDTPAPATQESTLLAKDAWALLQRLLDGLSDERRQVFVLYEIADLTVPEIANMLGWPVQTAYSRLKSAREQIEVALAKRRRLEGGR